MEGKGMKVCRGRKQIMIALKNLNQVRALCFYHKSTFLIWGKCCHPPQHSIYPLEIFLEISRWKDPQLLEHWRVTLSTPVTWVHFSYLTWTLLIGRDIPQRTPQSSAHLHSDLESFLCSVLQASMPEMDKLTITCR